jgi:hypothetical protein
VLVENNLRIVSYKARTYTQLYKWVNGNPIHNDVDNECCPDFSCCNGTGKSITSYITRVSYRDKFRKSRRKDIIRNIVKC